MLQVFLDIKTDWSISDPCTYFYIFSFDIPFRWDALDFINILLV